MTDKRGYQPTEPVTGPPPVRPKVGSNGGIPTGELKPFPPRATPPVKRPESHAHAEKTLAETPYLAYCLVQSCKLFIRLVEKKWPEAA